jgi:hypothetical protein
VRLSGQDSGRGTFSQRHSVLIDQSNESKYVPLNHVAEGQARFEVIDSPLNEAAVLGFEYGYSSAEPNALVMWEAQFGDFANGAQVIIDQFICSGESKWLRMNGLVMLLPHGYEGQGPEHSSARLERYLQLSAEDNWQVDRADHAGQLLPRAAPPDAPHVPQAAGGDDAQVAAAPQGLRLDAGDFGPDSSFHRILARPTRSLTGEQVRRVLLCSGKVYFDLVAERRKRKIDDIAILRIEQLYPFPISRLGAAAVAYPHAEVVWCQEEPENMGAWHFVDRRIERALATIDVRASGRSISAGRNRRRPRPARRARISRSRPIWSTARSRSAEERAWPSRSRFRRWANRSPRRPSPSGWSRRATPSQSTSRCASSRPTRSPSRCRRPRPARSPTSPSPKAPPCRWAACCATSRRRRRGAAQPSRRRTGCAAAASRTPCPRTRRRPPARVPPAAQSRRLGSGDAQAARGEGVAPAAIQPTGKDGRATKADVMAALSSISAQPAPRPSPRVPAGPRRAPTARSGCA